MIGSFARLVPSCGSGVHGLLTSHRGGRDPARLVPDREDSCRDILLRSTEQKWSNPSLHPPAFPVSWGRVPTWVLSRLPASSVFQWGHFRIPRTISSTSWFQPTPKILSRKAILQQWRAISSASRFRFGVVSGGLQRWGSCLECNLFGLDLRKQLVFVWALEDF